MNIFFATNVRRETTQYNVKRKRLTGVCVPVQFSTQPVTGKGKVRLSTSGRMWVSKYCTVQMGFAGLVKLKLHDDDAEYSTQITLVSDRMLLPGITVFLCFP